MIRTRVLAWKSYSVHLKDHLGANNTSVSHLHMYKIYDGTAACNNFSICGGWVSICLVEWTDGWHIRTFVSASMISCSPQVECQYTVTMVLFHSHIGWMYPYLCAQNENLHHTSYRLASMLLLYISRCRCMCVHQDLSFVLTNKLRILTKVRSFNVILSFCWKS